MPAFKRKEGNDANSDDNPEFSKHLSEGCFNASYSHHFVEILFQGQPVTQFSELKLSVGVMAELNNSNL